MHKCLAAFLAFIALASVSWAQSKRASAIDVTVRDQTGALVPAAVISITEAATGLQFCEGITGPAGNYRSCPLPPASYRLSVRTAGFDTFEAIVSPKPGETQDLRVTLRVATLEQRFSITEPATQEGSAVTGQAINTVARLPGGGRDYLWFTALAPSTETDLSNTSLPGRGNLAILVNGQRASSNNYEIDGGNANDFSSGQLARVPLPSPASVAQFSVQTSLYDASQGGHLGGNIQVTLNSGGGKGPGKRLYGEAYEFFGNDRLNANDFFLNSQGSATPASRQNQFGGSLGGALPKVGYFFLNVEHSGEVSGLDKGEQLNSLIAALPLDRSATNLARVFHVPDNAINPVSLALLNLKGDYFGPGVGGGYLIPSVAPIAPGAPSGRLVVSRQGRFGDNQFTTTFDKSAGKRDKLSVRWFFSDSYALIPFFSAGPEALPQSSTVPQHNRFFTVHHTHVFGPAAVNEAGFSFNRYASALDPGELVPLAAIGATRPNAAQFPAAFAFDVGDPGFGMGTSVNDDRGMAGNTFEFRDTVSKSWRKHMLRVGGAITRYQINEYNNFATRGVVSFRADPEGLTALQNFLLGNIRFTQGQHGFTRFGFRDTDYSAFVQDDWRISGGFSISAGLRWDPLGVPKEVHNLLANLTGVNTDHPAEFVFPAALPGLGTPGVSTCTYRQCRMWKNLAPRFGFAWRPAGSSHWVIRGGYGMYYDRFPSQVLEQSATGAGGFVRPVAEGAVPLADPFAGMIPLTADPASAQPIPKLLSIGNNGLGAPVFSGPLIGLLTYGDRTLLSPYTLQWNLTVQRSFGANWLFEAGWIGANGARLLFSNKAYNLAWPATRDDPLWQPTASGWTEITGSTLANLAARVPTKWLGFSPGLLQPVTKDGGSTYHSLETRVTRRFRAGLIQAAYTFSKSMDNTSGSLADLDDGLSGNTEWNGNQRFSRAVSDFDRPHRLVLTFVYELPFFRKQEHWRGKLLGGWGASGVITYQSGTPFTVIDSSGGSIFGMDLAGGTSTAQTIGNDYRDINGHGALQNRLNEYFNTAAFAPAPCVSDQLQPVACSSPIAAGTTLGNSARNPLRGPFQQNWDLAVFKRISFAGRQAVEFRAEALNAWNHPVFAAPGCGIGACSAPTVDIQNPNAGAIVSTANRPRSIQLVMRYSW